MRSSGLQLFLGRARSDAPMLAVLAGLSFVATFLLTFGPVVSTSIGEALFRSEIEAGEPADVGISVSGQSAVGDITALAADLDKAANVAASTTWIAGTRSTTYLNGTYLNAGDPNGETGDSVVTSLVAIADDGPQLLWKHGRAPASGEAALHADAAELLGLEVGDQVTTDLIPEGLPLVGVFEPADPADDRWWRDPTVRDGVVAGESFVTVGPIVVALSTLAEVQPVVSAQWRVRPDVLKLRVTDAPGLRQLPRSIEAAMDDSPLITTPRVESGLVDVVDDFERVSSSSSLIVVAILLLSTALAIPALSVAGRILLDARQADTLLLAGRGASRTQLVVASAAEGSLIATVVAAAVLPATRLALAGLNTTGATAGLRLDPVLPAGAILGLLAGSLFSLLVLLLPTLSNLDGLDQEGRRDSGQGSWIRRSGLDIVIVILAGLGLWQIRRAQVDSAGAIGAETLVAIVPALGLIAGTVIANRVIPVLGLSARLLTARSNRLAGPLSARNLSRRPQRAARTSILVLLAVAIGGFALIHRATSRVSLVEQADAEVGADLLAEIDQRSGRVPDQLLAALAAEDGLVNDVRPIALASGELGTAAVEILLTDVAHLPEDGEALASATWVPNEQGLEIAGSTLTVDVASHSPEDPPVEGELRLGLTVLDRDGLAFQIPAAAVAIGASETVRFPLAEPATPDGTAINYRAPLRILEITLELPASQPSFTTDDQREGTRVVIETSDWAIDGQPLGVVISGEEVEGRQGSGRTTSFASITEAGESVRVDATIGFARSPGSIATYRLPIGPGSDVPAAVQVVVTPAILASQNLAVGDPVEMKVGPLSVRATIIGTVDSVPMLPRAPMAVIADLGQISVAAFNAGEALHNPTHLAARSSRSEASEAAEIWETGRLRSPIVTTRWQRAEVLARDPGQLGISLALLIALGTSLIGALAGLTANAVHDRQQRRDEFAVLQALGTPKSTMSAMLLIETILLMATAVVLGLALAVTMAALVLPSLAITRDGLPAVPEPSLVMPWLDLIILVVVVVAAGLLASFVAFRSLVRADESSVLRLGGTTR